MTLKQKPGWKSIPWGGLILTPGNAEEYLTGGWRTKRPVWQEENCIQCLFCWVYCPDSSVMVKDGKMTGFDYDHCKGCGICAEVCPGKKKVKAIVMESESRKEG